MAKVKYTVVRWHKGQKYYPYVWYGSRKTPDQLAQDKNEEVKNDPDTYYQVEERKED